ncbi:Endospore coat-associated protein YheD [Paenibacillus sp. CECT 9249]|uniref:YheC/YheD family protein n=1 Tax=Paenibacillus sp. CECT 9249 TaxID=2845385 RepID=UPI001EF9C657|nr:YheC/YheD family protein [Paenibacillus sp. CECT 9249]CAH0120840.1 Endospore coat-associated protein YheD [Paenibacillus sp. CECT 9249]
MTKGANKLGKYRFMKGSPQLAPHLPATRRLTKRNFNHFLARFGSVIVKPNGGSGGAGIIRVTAAGKARYVLHKENKRTTVRGKHTAYARVRKRIGLRRYIVQRRIQLATINKRPFDVRVIVQRRRNSHEWTVTGELAKVAGKGYIVTNNTRSKGRLLPIRTGIERSSLGNRSVETMVSDLHRVALAAAARLNQYYPRKRIFGLDMGLDRNGHVWIIEANKAPSMSHFIKMKNYETYRRIMSYKRG